MSVHVQRQLRRTVFLYLKNQAAVAAVLYGPVFHYDLMGIAQLTYSVWAPYMQEAVSPIVSLTAQCPQVLLFASKQPTEHQLYFAQKQ
ncbi:hypothetical protein D3C81_651210 [compost metagenome]